MYADGQKNRHKVNCTIQIRHRYAVSSRRYEERTQYSKDTHVRTIQDMRRAGAQVWAGQFRILA